MKADAWYDITCVKCARSLSSDFGKGMFMSARAAQKAAYSLGFNKAGECPICNNTPVQRKFRVMQYQSRLLR